MYPPKMKNKRQMCQDSGSWLPWVGETEGVLCKDVWVIGKVLVFMLGGGLKEGCYCVFTRMQHGCTLC